MRMFLVTLAALLPVTAYAGDLPDPTLTPGAVNPAVTQSNIFSTVCVPGWTKTVRPPASYTNHLKAEQMAAEGLAEPPRQVEEDHRVPLACGGAPTDPKNLSPEEWDGLYGAHAKDKLESALHRAVCHNEITLAECQRIFMGDWRIEYDRRFGKPGLTPVSGTPR